MLPTMKMLQRSATTSEGHYARHSMPCAQMIHIFNARSNHQIVSLHLQTRPHQPDGLTARLAFSSLIDWPTIRRTVAQSTPIPEASFKHHCRLTLYLGHLSLAQHLGIQVDGNPSSLCPFPRAAIAVRPLYGTLVDSCTARPVQLGWLGRKASQTRELGIASPHSESRISEPGAILVRRSGRLQGECPYEKIRNRGMKEERDISFTGATNIEGAAVAQPS
ncbi:hypothetical protein B0I35DRAFT_125350 [Stachybotrys elegans]|uniref:Uncharacterized protein n=1 Tax=Stachybotrys elegans TaxID=80388 RepID=A0A8K0WUX4_9HYPO|nr:hypothetical protein B0I35DRAFT_125350 [Stachybotrys elegans]